MLSEQIKKKLENLRELPTIPFVLSEVLNVVDNTDMSAKALAAMIERDQALTARVLRVANSPFYGFSRKISTVDLAIVVMGLNSIKEVVLSIFMQKLFTRISKSVFDINEFWSYSVFCGACSRFLARKLNYRVGGEAFVAGLMHDVGIIIMLQYFPKTFTKIKKLQLAKRLTLVQAEEAIMKTNHSEIGAWFAERWNLPEKLRLAIENHHIKYEYEGEGSYEFSQEEEPITVIVSLAEWFAAQMGYMGWAGKDKFPALHFPMDRLPEIFKHDVVSSKSLLAFYKQDIEQEYQRASVFTEPQGRPLHGRG